MSVFEFYRRSALGLSLRDSLEELISHGYITPQLALKVLSAFDRAMLESLDATAGLVKSKATMKAHLHNYRSYNEVWTMTAKDAVFKMDGLEGGGGGGAGGQIESERVKIVACKWERRQAER